jgi:hypothetical protein
MAAKYAAIKYNLRASASQPWLSLVVLNAPRLHLIDYCFGKGAFDKYFQQFRMAAQ